MHWLRMRVIHGRGIKYHTRLRIIRGCKPCGHGSVVAHTGAHHIKWPAGRSTALAPPCLLLCFCNIVWTENKKKLPYLTALCWRSVVWGGQLKKGRQLFWGKKCNHRENPSYAPDSGWLGLRMFWPRNDPPPLTRIICGGKFPMYTHLSAAAHDRRREMADIITPNLWLSGLA